MFRPSGSSVLFLVLMAGACSPSTDASSSPDVTVLVSNESCHPKSCSPIHVYAFPENQPRTPGGFWALDLGVVNGHTACLTLPASSTFTIAGPADTTRILWTTGDPVSLGAIQESAAVWEAGPTTANFVPGGASGWKVSLPGGARPAPDGKCTG
jgi:hypothetical protein